MKLVDILPGIGMNEEIPDDMIVTGAVMIVEAHSMDEEYPRLFAFHSDGMDQAKQVGLIRLWSLRVEDQALEGWLDEED